MIKKVSESAFDIVGFSIACSDSVNTCKTLANVVRKHSINKNVKIMAGGSAILRNNKLSKATGVDSIAQGALEALKIASTICAQECLDNSEVDHV